MVNRPKNWQQLLLSATQTETHVPDSVCNGNVFRHKGSELNDTNAFDVYAESNTLNGLTIQTFKSLSAFIYERTGIFYPEKKKYLLEARIRKRLQTLGIQDFEEYDRYLRYGQHQDNEFSFLYSVITTNETSFFRNVPQLEAFAAYVVPSLIESHGDSVMHLECRIILRRGSVQLRLTVPRASAPGISGA